MEEYIKQFVVDRGTYKVVYCWTQSDGSPHFREKPVIGWAVMCQPYEDGDRRTRITPVVDNKWSPDLELYDQDMDPLTVAVLLPTTVTTEEETKVRSDVADTAMSLRLKDRWDEAAGVLSRLCQVYDVQKTSLAKLATTHLGVEFSEGPVSRDALLDAIKDREGDIAAAIRFAARAKHAYQTRQWDPELWESV